VVLIAVDRQTIDYGYVKFGETRAFEFAVTNAGDGVLRFKEKPYIEILEGC
jgi:mannose-1-phosphate guanylyltransferase